MWSLPATVSLSMQVINTRAQRGEKGCFEECLGEGGVSRRRWRKKKADGSAGYPDD